MLETDASGGVVVDQPDARKVFVIHGRNEAARSALFHFLRAIDLIPIEWSQAIGMTGQGSPYIGTVLDAAFSQAQAVIVLQTPDDVAYLHPSMTDRENDPECEPQLQPRPNVLFEAGMAMGRDPDRTVIVEFGSIKTFSDIHGRHVVRLDNSVGKRQDLADRLRTAGCSLDTSGRDWHSAGDLTPPPIPGDGLPLGRRLPRVRSSTTPQLDARYFNRGGKRGGAVEIVNLGPVDVYELDVSLGDQKEGIIPETDDLPVPKLPVGKSVCVLRLHPYLGSWSGGHFTFTAKGKTEDGSSIQEELFVSLGG